MRLSGIRMRDGVEMSNAVAGRSPKSRASKPEIQVEQLRADDLLAAGRLLYKTADEIRKNAGLEPCGVKLRTAPPLLSHIYSQDPDLSWGAYVGDELVGFSTTHMRDRQWHVAYLFVDSEYQNRGLGTRLLKTGIDEATRREAYFMSQCTFIYNTKAIGLCTKLGLFPRKNLMLMEGPPASDVVWPALTSPIEGRLIDSTALLSDLNQMDREVRGINRAVDHCYWLADDDHEGHVFYNQGNLIGYAYITHQGFIGPVLTLRDSFLPEIVLYCLRILGQRPRTNPKIWLNGKNFTTLQLILNHGFEIKEIALLMTNRMFCDVRRYVPASLAVF